MTPPREPSRPEPLDASQSLPDRVAAGLARLALVFRHEAWRSSGETGLTPTQSQILVAIVRSPEAPGLKRIAELLAITMGTASEAVSTLVEKGLVLKERSPEDRRAIVLTLTAAGRRAARDAAAWPDPILEAADSLPPRDRAGLVRGLVGMIRELQARGAVPTARMCVECRFFRPNAHAGAAKAHHCAYIDAPIGDDDLRFDCPEMEPVAVEARPRLWNLFIEGRPLGADPAGDP